MPQKGLAHLLHNSPFLDLFFFFRNVYILKQGGRSSNYIIFVSSCFHLGQIHECEKGKALNGFSSNSLLIVLKRDIFLSIDCYFQLKIQNVNTIAPDFLNVVIYS